MENKVSIILPCYNSGKHLSKAIDSIINNTKHPYELILVESESTDGTDKVCDDYKIMFPDKIKVFHTKKEGITKAQNFGIKQAGENDIYLTQDDVIIPKLYERDWLEELVKISKVEDCGVVSTMNAGGISGPTYISGMRWVGTWSLFIPRKTINRIGILDEGFSPGPGDDLDYSYRIIKEKLKIYIASFWVDHHRKTENFNDNIQDAIHKNAAYFRKKHNVISQIMDLCDEKVIVCIETFEPGGCMGAKWGKIDDLQTTQIINKFTQQFKDNDITLDIGANTGLMSLAVHRGKVISFEPTKKTYDVLLKNVLLNDKFIIPINKALWSCNVRYKIVENKKNHGENKIEFTNDGDDVTLTIDELNLNNVRLIKIDTEGADMEVVEGGLETIKRCKPLLIIESVDKEFMKSINYKCLGYSNINTIWEAEK